MNITIQYEDKTSKSHEQTYPEMDIYQEWKSCADKNVLHFLKWKEASTKSQLKTNHQTELYKKYVLFDSLHYARNLLNLLEFLAEAFRCHVHHFQCLTVLVELENTPHIFK